MENLFYKYFILLLATIQGTVGLAELLAPARMYRLWKKLISSRFFFIHGFLLICAGFPLTLYKGELSGILFYIGLFIVLTGPFVIIYPDKLKKSFYEAEIEIKPENLYKLVYFEAFMRIGLSFILFFSYYKTYFIHLN